MATILVGNDLVFELSGYTNVLTGVLVADATVTLVVLDKAGEELAGGSWPLPIPPASGEPGVYREGLTEALAALRGTPYLGLVYATGGTGGATARWEIDMPAQVRTG